MAAPPDVIRWSPRSLGHGDCTVAAIELACGVTYETALSAALGAEPQVLTKGMNAKQIRVAMGFLGHKIRVRTKYDLTEDTGILAVTQPHVKDSGHVVYLWEGRIIEPKNDRQQLWLDAQLFLTHYRYVADYLITIEGEQ